MEKLKSSLLSLFLMIQPLSAQLSITSLDTQFRIDFDSTLTGVNNGLFSGGGFLSVPVSGQIDSDGLIVTGMSTGDMSFGSSAASGEFAMGSSPGGESSGGIYAFEVSPGNAALGIQPTTAVWTPGAVILKVINSTGGNVTSFSISYKVYSYNDQDRSGSLKFYYSADNSAYFNTSMLDFTSAQTKELSPAWSSATRTVKISAHLPDSGELFLKWEGSDAGGSGSRDEIALDDISITAHLEDIKVIISEVADHSTSDQEYVEIFNGGSGPVDIEGWKLIERYNPGNLDERAITFNPVSQKNSGGENYFELKNGEYAVVVRSDHASLKSGYTIGDSVAIFEDSFPPAMNGDERYLLADALGNRVDNFGAWEYINTGSFRLTAAECYERKSDITNDGESEANWIVYSNDAYNYTPGSANNSPLPVELVRFYAKVKSDFVLLCWETANEVNNYGFDIERLYSGAAESAADIKSDWQIAGFEQGHGNSYSAKNYSFKDYPGLPGKYFYRLKQIDLDGRFNYSDSISVSFSKRSEKIKLFQNYPNPLSEGSGSAHAGNQVTSIKYVIPAVETLHATTLRQENKIIDVKLVVYDILGREVATLVDEHQSPGNYQVLFDASALPSGIYFYRIETPRGSVTQKMIIMK